MASNNPVVRVREHEAQPLSTFKNSKGLFVKFIKKGLQTSQMTPGASAYEVVGMYAPLLMLLRPLGTNPPEGVFKMWATTMECVPFSYDSLVQNYGQAIIEERFG